MAGQAGCRVCPPAVKDWPGLVPRAAARSAAASLRRWSAVRIRTGSTGRRSRVRASIRDLRCRSVLAPADLLGADRAGHGPGTPAGRVFDRPVSEVQVERADRGQAFAVVDPGDGARSRPEPDARRAGLGTVAGAVSRRRRLRRCRLEAGDAGVVRFDIGPEQLAEEVPRATPGWCSPGRAGVLAGSRPAGRGPGGRRAGNGRSAPRACAGRRCGARAASAGACSPKMPSSRSIR